jgi:beta-barrel assembly-enhancing protease
VRGIFALAAMLIAQNAIAAPKPADIAGYQYLVEQDLRLATTGYRIAYANRDFCKQSERSPGFVMHDILQYPDAEIARAAFGFTRPVSVSAVVAGGPAALAGLRFGDGLTGMSSGEWDWSKYTPKDANARISAIKTDMRKWLADHDSVALQIERGGKTLSILIEPVMVCASDFQIDTVKGKDAGADGHMVSVSIGLARYAANDDEFAFIVAHEMAHNILGHRAQLDAANARKNSKAVLATEVEADRLSVWLMANARYDPDGATRFAMRCRKDSCLGLFTDSKHLGWKKRAEIMQVEIDLIRAAQLKDTVISPPLLRGR